MTSSFFRLNIAAYAVISAVLCCIVSIADDAVGGTDGMIQVKQSILVIYDSQASSVEKNAADAFANRLRLRSGLDVTVAGQEEARGLQEADAKAYGFLILAATAGSNGVLEAVDVLSSSKPEGFSIDIGRSAGWALASFPGVAHRAVVCGNDSRGVLYGLGKLLRLMDFTSPGFSIQPQKCEESPATAQRGVYFATHFNNFYESAPIEEIEAYIEDMALWGFNSIWTWFDMGWYPEGFWDDPNSKGTELLNRIRRINDKTRSLGLTAGLTTVANEGFKSQPPKELLADMSDKRGGFYPESTICPSKPGGMELILKDRCKILELIGPIDAYITWPYDQGGCGCAQCRPWARTFMKINPVIATEVRRLNPNVKILVSTWYFNAEEMQSFLSEMKTGPFPYDGILTETKWLDAFEFPTDGERVVFPEISMEGSLFCGYGASGANPIQSKFSTDAKKTAERGFGALLYSEGIYEDLNKIIWACTLWNPARGVDDILDEYARFYFEPAAAADWAALINGLEKTWPPEALPDKSTAAVQQLFELAGRLGASAHDPIGKTRWQYFMDRAEMDWRMVQIGSDMELLREAKTLLTDIGYSRTPGELRPSVQTLRDKAAARAQAIEGLFQFHWEYLERAHLEQTTALVLTPPTFIGQRDWDYLERILDEALKEKDGGQMRLAILKGFKQWFWHNNITMDFCFL